MRMKMPASRWTDGAWVDKARRLLVQELLAGPLGLRFQDAIQWFYDPMAVTAFAGHMGEQAIVFDCMDQLSQFRGAPKELIRRERELLNMADVVFAGGPKIGRDKIKYNPNTHSYGCGVDVKHFGEARLASTEIPADVAGLTGPVFGFFGVVDERMDYALVAALADAHPHGHVVIVGPMTKVDPATIPQRPNLHWLGGRDYALLPAYVKKFDVCLMPFALNEATEYINPTKALEYMATGKPIVSTPVEDVVLQFTGAVKISRDKREFRRAVQRSRREAGRGVHQARPGTGATQFVGVHRGGDGRAHRRRHRGKTARGQQRRGLMVRGSGPCSVPGAGAPLTRGSVFTPRVWFAVAVHPFVFSFYTWLLII